VQAKDLHVWKQDAEAFHHASDVGGLQENLRTCAETLYLSLFEVLGIEAETVSAWLCPYLMWCHADHLAMQSPNFLAQLTVVSPAYLMRLQKNRERVAPLVLGALQRACDAAPPGGTASLPGPRIGGVPVRPPATAA
jgi:hypothetical protein